MFGFELVERPACCPRIAEEETIIEQHPWCEYARDVVFIRYTIISALCPKLAYMHIYLHTHVCIISLI